MNGNLYIPCADFGWHVVNVPELWVHMKPKSVKGLDESAWVPTVQPKGVQTAIFEFLFGAYAISTSISSKFITLQNLVPRFQGHTTLTSVLMGWDKDVAGLKTTTHAGAAAAATVASPASSPGPSPLGPPKKKQRTKSGAAGTSQEEQLPIPIPVSVHEVAERLLNDPGPSETSPLSSRTKLFIIEMPPTGSVEAVHNTITGCALGTVLPAFTIVVITHDGLAGNAMEVAKSWVDKAEKNAWVPGKHAQPTLLQAVPLKALLPAWHPSAKQQTAYSYIRDQSAPELLGARRSMACILVNKDVQGEDAFKPNMPWLHTSSGSITGGVVPDEASADTGAVHEPQNELDPKGRVKKAVADPSDISFVSWQAKECRGDHTPFMITCPPITKEAKEIKVELDGIEWQPFKSTRNQLPTIAYQQMLATFTEPGDTITHVFGERCQVLMGAMFDMAHASSIRAEEKNIPCWPVGGRHVVVIYLTAGDQNRHADLHTNPSLFPNPILEVVDLADLRSMSFNVLDVAGLKPYQNPDSRTAASRSMELVELRQKKKNRTSGGTQPWTNVTGTVTIDSSGAAGPSTASVLLLEAAGQDEEAEAPGEKGQGGLSAVAGPSSMTLDSMEQWMIEQLGSDVDAPAQPAGAGAASGKPSAALLRGRWLVETADMAEMSSSFNSNARTAAVSSCPLTWRCTRSFMERTPAKP